MPRLEQDGLTVMCGREKGWVLIKNGLVIRPGGLTEGQWKEKGKRGSVEQDVTSGYNMEEAGVAVQQTSRSSTTWICG